LQEVILAKDVLFICGSRVLEFELLRSASFQMYQVGISQYLKELVSNTRDIQRCPSLINLGLLRVAFSTSLLNAVAMLHKARRHHVREPVDRIYGLLGVMEEWVKQEVIVDYSPEARTQYWKLYISVAKGIVRSGELDLLIIAASEERPLQLPSWIPNWNSPESTVPVAAHFYAGFHQNNKVVLKMSSFPTRIAYSFVVFGLGLLLELHPLSSGFAGIQGGLWVPKASPLRS